MWLESRVKRTVFDRASVALRFGALRRGGIAAQAAAWAGSSRSRHNEALALVDALIALRDAGDPNALIREPSASQHASNESVRNPAVPNRPKEGVRPRTPARFRLS